MKRSRAAQEIEISRLKDEMKIRKRGHGTGHKV